MLAPLSAQRSFSAMGGGPGDFWDPGLTQREYLLSLLTFTQVLANSVCLDLEVGLLLEQLFSIL